MKKTLTPRNKPLKEALKQDKLQIITDKAFDEFRDKTLAEKQKPLYSISNIALILMHVLSISFAGLFVFGFILKMISGIPIEEIDLSTTPQALLVVAGVLITASILIVVEAGKVALGNIFSDTFLKKRKMMLGPLFFLVVLMACSIGSSVNGSVELAEMRNAVDPSALVNEAELKGGYDELIAAERAEIAAAKVDPNNMIYSNGKTELSWITRKDNAIKEKRINKLIDLKAEDSERAFSDNADLKQEALIDTEYYVSIAVVVASIVEAFILFLIFYRRQYLFYTYKESNLPPSSPTLKHIPIQQGPFVMKPNFSKLPKQAAIPVQAAIDPVVASEVAPAQAEAVNKVEKLPRQTQAPAQAIKSTRQEKAPAALGIGFAQLLQKVDPMNPEQAADIGYFQKHEKTVSGYLEGRSIKELAEQSGLSESTVKTIRKKVRFYV